MPDQHPSDALDAAQSRATLLAEQLRTDGSLTADERADLAHDVQAATAEVARIERNLR